MKKWKVKKRTFWIVGAILLYFIVVIGLLHGLLFTPPRPSSNVNTTKRLISDVNIKNSARQIERPLIRKGLEPNKISRVKVNSKKESTVIRQLINTDKGVKVSSQENNSAAISTKNGGGYFQCVTLKKDNIKSKIKTSVGECIDYCWKRRKPSALLRKGDQCSCINNSTEYEDGDLSYCNKRCASTKRWRQNCGGTDHFSKYETGYVKEPEFDYYDKEKLIKLLQGCFRQTKIPDGVELKTERLHPSMCIEFCKYKKYKYAAIYNSIYCQCNGVKRYFTALNSACPECSRNKEYKCGGKRKMIQIYRTGYPDVNTTGRDERFEDLTWTKSAEKKIREYNFFDLKDDGKGKYTQKIKVQNTKKNGLGRRFVRSADGKKKKRRRRKKKPGQKGKKKKRKKKRKIGKDGKPLKKRRRKIGKDGKPLKKRRRKIGKDGKPLKKRRRKIGKDGKPLKKRRRKIGKDGKPLKKRRRKIGKDGKPLKKRRRKKKKGMRRKIPVVAEKETIDEKVFPQSINEKVVPKPIQKEDVPQNKADQVTKSVIEHRKKQLPRIKEYEDLPDARLKKGCENELIQGTCFNIANLVLLFICMAIIAAIAFKYWKNDVKKKQDVLLQEKMADEELARKLLISKQDDED